MRTSEVSPQKPVRGAVIFDAAPVAPDTIPDSPEAPAAPSETETPRFTPHFLGH